MHATKAWAEHLTRSEGIVKKHSMLYAGPMVCSDTKCTHVGYVGLTRIKVICWRVQITTN